MMRQGVQYQRLRSSSEEDLEIELVTRTQFANETPILRPFELGQALKTLDEKAKQALTVLDDTFIINTVMEYESLLNHNRNHLIEIERMVQHAVELLHLEDGKRKLLNSFPWDEYYLDRNTHFPLWNLAAHEINHLVNEIHDYLVAHDTECQAKHEKYISSYSFLCRSCIQTIFKQGFFCIHSIPPSAYIVCMLFAMIMGGWFYFTTVLHPSSSFNPVSFPDLPSSHNTSHDSLSFINTTS
jgi:hypothetical protein